MALAYRKPAQYLYPFSHDQKKNWNKNGGRLKDRNACCKAKKRFSCITWWAHTLKKSEKGLALNVDVEISYWEISCFIPRNCNAAF